MSVALAQEVRTVLTSPHAREIRFRVRDNLVVTGEGFAALAPLITHNRQAPPPRIWVREQANLLTLHGMDGVYYPSPDRLHLVSLAAASTPRGHGHIIHECTHAQIDMRAVDTPIRSEEGAAFLAEAWYHVAAGNEGVLSSFQRAAFVPIARRLHATASTLPATEIIQLTQADINAIRLAVADYSLSFYGSNGITGCTVRTVQAGRTVVCSPDP